MAEPDMKTSSLAVKPSSQRASAAPPPGLQTSARPPRVGGPWARALRLPMPRTTLAVCPHALRTSDWAVYSESRPLEAVVAEIFETPPRARNVVESRHSPVLTHEFMAQLRGRETQFAGPPAILRGRCFRGAAAPRPIQ